MNTPPAPGHNDSAWQRLPKVKPVTPGVPAEGRGAADARGTPQPPKGALRSGPKGTLNRGMVYLVLLGGLACVVVAFLALAVVSTPAVASLLMVASTSTYPANFAQSNIIKPTFTPTPTLTFTPTVTPSPIPTETPGVVEAAIVEDTPTPERVYAQEPDVAPSYSGSKYILVDISEQHMYVYEGDTLLWSFVASTGMNNATRVGTFAVQSKIPNAYGATWNIWMPNWLGIYWAGGLENGIHSLPILPSGAQLWSGFLGRPISYGCVVLDAYDSTLLYNWAEIGTPVEIRW